MISFIRDFQLFFSKSFGRSTLSTGDDSHLSLTSVIVTLGVGPLVSTPSSLKGRGRVGEGIYSPRLQGNKQSLSLLSTVYNRKVI